MAPIRSKSNKKVARKKPVVIVTASNTTTERKTRRVSTRSRRNGMTGKGLESSIRELSRNLAEQYIVDNGYSVAVPSGFTSDALCALMETANKYLEVYSAETANFARSARRSIVTDQHVKSAIRKRYRDDEMRENTINEIDKSLARFALFKKKKISINGKKTAMKKKINCVLQPKQCEKVLRHHVLNGQNVSPKATAALTVGLECFLGDWLDVARALAMDDGQTRCISARHVNKAIVNDPVLRHVIDPARNAIFGRGTKGSLA